MAINRHGDLYNMIRSIVWEELKYYKHYLAKVVNDNDQQKSGGVLVTVDELGFHTEAEGMWVYPRILNGLQTPKVGSFVEIYFMGGNPNDPRYIGNAVEMKDSKPTEYGDKFDFVLFEHPTTGDFIKYNQNEKRFEIKSGKGTKIYDDNNNSIDMTKDGIAIDDANGNTLEMISGEIKLNGSNLEVLQ